MFVEKIRHAKLKAILFLIGTSILISGCAQSSAEKRASAREITIQKIKSSREEYDSQIPTIQKNCEGMGSEVARVSCEAPLALKVAREAGLPSSDIEYIAEGTNIELQLAHKVDNGQLSKAEAEAQFQIELVRLQSRFQQRSASNNLKRLQALSSLRSSLPSRAPAPINPVLSRPALIAPPRPPVYTNCSTSLGSINCTSF